MQTRKRVQGFTLLEVMVVLAIIGSIMALVATNIIGSATDAQVKTTKSQMKLIEGALDMYKLDNFTYPTTEQGLEALISKPSSSPVPKNYRSSGYLKGNSVPTDAWGNEFLYYLEKGQYEIVSLGADGQEGGEAEYADISYPE
ncbi:MULTISPECIES: type II secretion system major pseudopilin GspG [unclassified Oceanobacter]|jgi:general secretion pathway protein G|uniref:type II secretion system major pseudopilin GspG n=1 Tax=unclassified Oceanobacter TaxID=2620260 RepID=UPI0026E20D9D|nr:MULTISPECIES: type II secretion system major pseudopilin GspG [unclassified Oceanobacter]MDO6681156.1 type II secretion system major pseudopilin GspG [Oceanobacter sp. 5_MG-2023]MDP2504272.1 type II secretion system major pseudopilin GspG [Oceanobacter sp. 3_MG-2023]MDP2546711.1 type II secretion system major pseudopilin GspG [Oceanobacter sp. 4_MG-2023]MDP2608549.1 type II secretion system major pseudopilin GspG [Oceanobacter sp. 1_MG-2023]MDP2611689.1 type II secretion system major pseudo